MLVPMTPVQILSPRAELPAVIDQLHRLGMLQLTSPVSPESVGPEPASPEADRRPAGAGPGDLERMAGLRSTEADLTALLGLAQSAGRTVADHDWLRPATPAVPAERLGALSPGLGPQLERIASLQAEYDTVHRYRDALAVLLPMEPELSLLSESDLARLGLATVVLVIDSPHADILGTLRSALHAAVGDRFHLAGAATGEQTIGCVLVAPHALLAELRALLAREHVRHVPLPAG